MDPDLVNFDDLPSKLFDLSLAVVVSELKNILVHDQEKEVYTFSPGITLPTAVTEKLLVAYQKANKIENDVLHCFNDRSVTPINNLILSNGNITDIGFKNIMPQNITYLTIFECENLTETINNYINEFGKNIKFIIIGRKMKRGMIMPSREFEFETPKLRLLSLNGFNLLNFPVVRTSILNQLSFLDLSDSFIAEFPMPKLPNLKTLILYNVFLAKELLSWVMQLHTLQFLDLSMSDKERGIYPRPDATLAKLVANLPLLEKLDLSCTNLAGTGAAAMVRVKTSDDSSSETSDEEEDSTYYIELCDVPGLVARVNKPLQFLGLYGTPFGASKRHHIPAITISGDATEEQLLVAANMYMKRPLMIKKVLNNLFYLFRNDRIGPIYGPLDVTLTAMEEHVSDDNIQISGSATLFYVVKGDEKENFGISLSRRIVQAVLVAMETHPTSSTIIRNCCLTICQFNVPTEVMFVYERLVQILISGMVVAGEVFVMRVGTYLFNSLACQVGKSHKKYLGDCGIVRCMLQIINNRLENDSCDDIMSMAWSTMWNVTDEMPQNCEKFLDDVGVHVFLKCVRMFPDKPDLLRNMMGLLCNVSEVHYLRPKLMEPRLVFLFEQLLDSPNDGIEVSYNAAGILAHLASDGEDAWPLEVLSRDIILARIAVVVERWDLSATRNINYRSFAPILSLLEVFHTPQCQHWGIWALANLTTVYPEKYCRVLEAEGGLPPVRALIFRRGPYSRIRELAKIVLDNCTNWFIANPQ